MCSTIRLSSDDGQYATNVHFDKIESASGEFIRLSSPALTADVELWIDDSGALILYTEGVAIDGDTQYRVGRGKIEKGLSLTG